MIFEKIVQLIICLLSLIGDGNNQGDMEKYLKLETKDVDSILKSDLPLIQ